MSINIDENHVTITIGEGNLGLTGMTSNNSDPVAVGVVINQFKNKVKITRGPLNLESIDDRIDKNAPIAVLLFTDVIGLDNLIGILNTIKSSLPEKE